MKYVDKLIDWPKNLKVTSIQKIIIGCLLALTLVMHVSLIKHVDALDAASSARDYLLEQNSNLKYKVDSLHYIYLEKEGAYIRLDSILDNKSKQLDKLKLENIQLQLKLADLENEMENITSDSSYNYLMHRYIPTQDSLPYGFAPNQIKNIHYDVLVLDQVKLININLTKSLLVSDSLYYTSTIKFNNCKEQTSILLQEKSLMQNNINNLEIINEGYKTEVKDQKRKKTVLGIGVAALLTYETIRLFK